MALIKCRCGKTEINFKHLSKEDFPEGFLHDCCPKEEPLKKVVIPEASEEPLKKNESVEPEILPKKKKSKKQE